ncbi:MAG: hypothetical protein O6952_00005, partial [Planctomycetota bacterium]|nr:hypothetical protein [Planctomycetota bacterium]
MAVSRADAPRVRIGLRRQVRRGIKRLRRRALYGVISVVLPLIRLLPWELAGSLGYRLGQLGYFLARRERTLALEHLEASLGDRHSESER